MDDIAADFERATRRKRRIAIGLLAAVLAAPFAWIVWTAVAARMRQSAAEEAWREEQRLDDAGKAQYRALLADMKQAVAAARTGWSQEVTPEKLASVEPGDAPCPRKLRSPTEAAAESYRQHGSIDVHYFGDVRFVEYAPGAPLAPTDLDRTDARLADLERKLASNEATRAELASLRSVARDAEVLIVVAARKAALVTRDHHGAYSYTAGTVVGDAYLYSYRGNRIVCAGAIDAQNTDAVSTTHTHQVGEVHDSGGDVIEALLARDLDVQLRRQLATRLRAI